MTAGLKVAVERRASRKLPGHLDRISLSVLEQVVSVKAFSEHAAVFHEDRSNHRVWAHEPGAAPRQLEGSSHENRVCVKHRELGAQEFGLDPSRDLVKACISP